MAKKKTAMEKINALRSRVRALGDKIKLVQDSCPHSAVKTTRTPCGFNGYSTDYTSSCVCELCDKSWYHDGYCSGTGHAQKERAA